jgi:hypothetical protein
MSYWEILVLAGVRLGCNYDYDALGERQVLLYQRFGYLRFDGDVVFG